MTRTADLSAPAFPGIGYTGWWGEAFTVGLDAPGQVFSAILDNLSGAAPEAVRSGVWAGGTGSITPVSTAHVTLTGAATPGNTYRVVITAAIANLTLDRNLQSNTAGIAGIDNLRITGAADDDTLISIENVIGGAGNDRVLIGNGAVGIVARGDVHDGGAGTDALEYSGRPQARRTRPGRSACRSGPIPGQCSRARSVTLDPALPRRISGVALAERRRHRALISPVGLT